jgi:hypothetical protein
MQLAPRLALASAIAVITATAACSSDSTGPGQIATNSALHFDSLYVQAKALSAADTNYDFRATALSDLELPAAFGATPASLSVTTAAGAETWKGFVFEEVMANNGTPSDSGRLVLAYRDGDAHTLVVTVQLANGSFSGTSLMTNDTVVVPASSASGNVALNSTGAACPAPPSGLTNPVIATAEQATCLSAQFGATLTLDFPAATGVDPALTHVAFPLTTFAGVRFLDPTGPAIGARIAKLISPAWVAH